MNACLKANKIVLPPKSQDYIFEDFAHFFKHLGMIPSFKSKYEDCVDMLGNIPMQIPAKIELKDLPYHNIKDKKGQDVTYQGNLEKGQPKGIGLKFTNKSFEFGFYNEFPNTIYKFYPEKKKITIIPNSLKTL